MQNYKIPKNLLSKGSTNTKTAKNELLTYILYLAPHKQNSKKINLCPKASKGCAAACLFSAGRGRFSNVINARVNKTEYFLDDKRGFITQLARELHKINDKALKGRYNVAIRLNGTSDLDFIYLLKKYSGFDVLQDDNFSNLIFYDYTAILGKVKKYINTNYHLTFSRKEDNENETLEALKMGANVSAVFSGDLPKYYKGFSVVDGDKSDIVMIEANNVILGLKAKGEAKNDKSGFVIHPEAVKPCRYCNDKPAIKRGFCSAFCMTEHYGESMNDLNPIK